MRKALWAMDKAPEMAYMLKRFTTESTFMARLSCDFKTLPITKTELGYVLRPDIQQSWYRIERMFTSITNILLKSQRDNDEVPSGAPWPLQHVYGYLKAHRNAFSARVAALRSRDACVLLLARCTMAIALSAREQDTGLPRQPPNWISILDGLVPAAWVDILRLSVVSDLSPGLRTGAFIDPRQSTAWVNHVPCMIRANLPVYICWTMPVHEVLAKYPFLADYVPPSEGVLNVTEESPSSLRFRWPSELVLTSPGSKTLKSIAAELTQMDGPELAYNDCSRDSLYERTSLVSDAFHGTI